MNKDMLNEALEKALTESYEELTGQDIPDYDFSDGFEDKMAGLISEQDGNADKKRRRGIILFFAAAAAVAAGTMSGCESSAQYPITSGDTKVRAGVYITYVMSAMSDEANSLFNDGKIQTMDDCFGVEKDGKSFSDIVKDNAIEKTKEHIAIDNKFKEFGLSLKEEDTAAMKDQIESAWQQSGGSYEYAGIGKESYREVMESSYKRQAIFDYYYAEGGIEEVTDSDVQNYVNENYIRYKMITYPKSTNEDETLKEQENKELEERFDQYLKEAEGKSFEEFDEVIEEHNKFLEEKQAEDALFSAKKALGDTPVAIDFTAVTQPFSLAKLLCEKGFNVKYIINDVLGEDGAAFDGLKTLAPDIEIYSAVNVNMLHFPEEDHEKVVAVGQKAAHYFNTDYFVNIVQNGGYYGFTGIAEIARLIEEAANAPKDRRTLISHKGIGCESCL